MVISSMKLCTIHSGSALSVSILTISWTWSTSSGRESRLMRFGSKKKWRRWLYRSSQLYLTCSLWGCATGISNLQIFFRCQLARSRSLILVKAKTTSVRERMEEILPQPPSEALLNIFPLFFGKLMWSMEILDSPSTTYSRAMFFLSASCFTSWLQWKMWLVSIKKPQNTTVKSWLRLASSVSSRNTVRSSVKPSDSCWDSLKPKDLHLLNLVI